MAAYSLSPVSLKLQLWRLENRKNGEMIAQAGFLHFLSKKHEYFQDLSQHIGTIKIMTPEKSANTPGIISALFLSAPPLHAITNWGLWFLFPENSLSSPSPFQWCLPGFHKLATWFSTCWLHVPFKPFTPGTGVMVLKGKYKHFFLSGFLFCKVECVLYLLPGIKP